LTALETMPAADGVAQVAAGARAATNLLVPQGSMVFYPVMCGRQPSEVLLLKDAALRVLSRRDWVPPPLPADGAATDGSAVDVAAANCRAHADATYFAWALLTWFGAPAVAEGREVLEVWSHGSEADRIAAATVLMAVFATPSHGLDEDEESETAHYLLAQLRALYVDVAAPVRHAVIKALAAALRTGIEEAMDLAPELFGAVAHAIATGSSLDVVECMAATRCLFELDSSLVADRFNDLCDATVAVARGDFSVAAQASVLDLVGSHLSDVPRLHKHGPGLSSVIDAAMALLAVHQGTEDDWRANLTSSTLESVGLTNSTLGSAAVEVIAVMARVLGPKVSARVAG